MFNTKLLTIENILIIAVIGFVAEKIIEYFEYN